MNIIKRRMKTQENIKRKINTQNATMRDMIHGKEKKRKRLMR